ncbi:hypothetical protein TGME49_209045 [Toxoplasma gondii ME49]|uniref:Uncharacterized protein n=4 Tax=Toxoplasma gondii TaxID=5811 RepID=A0A125YTU5_TOXGV|nr:hypothetical protein TGME49_209045 [Toxoplasma gondii ME49]EPT32352.1 hypothetical protein TGME49_209045 [Toxoplasma gondii ME49]ESS29467.1 hypothetical protein TGVEG_209045 [Toxoplasma gondii VEG]KFG34948.1 hypothetical protein TGDOM2_209045 [Toxoplasma gondii GAB2-2007-GAL-DOM2]KYF41318.1 hypothetical protein TGARI_209045 [Toxoplasma gondii ARI]|eukprot:XP_018638461.1 hypothetical protein TGME49_209045 [Toxoplasma gondii ME49]
MGTEAEDYLGAHRRHALYVTPESPSADLWSTVFGCIQDNDFEGFVKSLELAIAAEDDNTAKQPNSERSSDTDQPEPPRPAEVEIFGCQSILAHAAAFSEKCLEYLVETCCSDVNIRSSG